MIPIHPPEEMEDLAILNPRADLDVLPGVGTSGPGGDPSDVLHLMDLWLKTSTLPDASDDRTPIGADATPPPPAGQIHAPEPPTPSDPELDTPSAAGTSGESDVDSLGQGETDPLMESLEQPSDPLEPDIPEVPVVTDTAADSKVSPRIQDSIQDPTIQDRPARATTHHSCGPSS